MTVVRLRDYFMQCILYRTFQFKFLNLIGNHLYSKEEFKLAVFASGFDLKISGLQPGTVVSYLRVCREQIIAMVCIT